VKRDSVMVEPNIKTGRVGKASTEIQFLRNGSSHQPQISQAPAGCRDLLLVLTKSVQPCSLRSWGLIELPDSTMIISGTLARELTTLAESRI